MGSLSYCLFDTPLGICAIAWDKESRAVRFFQLPEASAAVTEARIRNRTGAKTESSAPAPIARVIARVCKHFSGEVQDFRDVAIDLDGSAPFSRQVYEAARAIPLGQTKTYGDVAKAIGRPAAARAVGQALGRNPIAVIVPCHRILGAGNKPGGFTAHGGLTTKERMLAVEGATFGLPATIRSEQDFRRATELLRARDSKLARCMVKPIKLRLKREQEPYATLLEAIVHQQLTAKAALTILGRVTALFAHATIPEPFELLATPDDALRSAGLSRAKAASLKDLASKAMEGAVPSSKEIVKLSDAEIIERLTSIRGVGRWTVEMMLIFNLGRIDVFPVDDFAIRRSVVEVHGLKEAPSRKALQELAETWRPYRTIASLYLWDYITKKNAAKSARS